MTVTETHWAFHCGAYSNKCSKFVSLSTWPRLNKASHWLLPLTGVWSRLSPLCWCRTADVIGCSPPVFTDSRGWGWKYLPPLLGRLFPFLFFFLGGGLSRLGSGSVTRVQCVAGERRNCTAPRSQEITGGRRRSRCLPGITLITLMSLIFGILPDVRVASWNCCCFPVFLFGPFVLNL